MGPVLPSIKLVLTSVGPVAMVAGAVKETSRVLLRLIGPRPIIVPTAAHKRFYICTENNCTVLYWMLSHCTVGRCLFLLIMSLWGAAATVPTAAYLLRRKLS